MKGKALVVLLSIFVSSVLFGCTPSAYVNYDISLNQVERPADAKERYGQQVIDKAEGKYYFEDELVKIIWVPSAYGISFILSNKTDHSIKIIWDEASYADTLGISHRVMHSGVKYIDRNNPQPPTVIVRKATVNDLIFPTDKVRYVSGRYGGWRNDPLLPTASYGVTAAQLEAESRPYIGKTFQILLPLEIENIVNEYIFTFRIDESHVISPHQ